MRAGLLIAIPLATLAFSTVEAAITQARVTGGTVGGTTKDGIASFKGIPFAAPPVGSLRWRPPQKPPPWRGVRRADSFALPCTQSPLPPPASGEDCLYLNVWTAATSRKSKLPVMVWIHGGSLTAGTPAYPVYDGTQFARDGVVLVTVAYRLGAFGFLAHPDLSRESGAGSGVYGLMDQIAALEWVRKNIAAFGGDPDRVTLFGESAGAWSVSVLASSAKAKGLFHRVIAQSGAIFAPAKKPTTPNEPFQNLLSLEFAERNGEALLASLGIARVEEARDRSAKDLLAAAEQTRHETLAVIDGDVVGGENIRLFEARRFNDVPLLLGYNSGEGIGNVPPGVTPEALAAAPRLSPCPTEAAAMLSLYSHATVDEAIAAIEESQRDGDFGWSAWKWARLQNAYGKSKSYLYYFDVHAADSPKGAAHFSDVAYVFGTQNAKDDARSALIRRYWINFAATGNPNGTNSTAWPAFENDSEMAMVFDENSSVRQLPHLQRIKAFDALFACTLKVAQQKS
jgi:para-nitrobenzyl esterase